MKNFYGQGTIRKRPDGRWEARIRDDEKRLSFYGKTKHEVKQKLKDAIEEISYNGHFNDEDMTVAQWINVWMQTFLEVRDSTLLRYKRDIRLYIEPNIGKIPLKELSALDVQHLYKKCKQKNLSAKSIHNLHGVLHSAMKKAVTLKYIKSNPCDDCTLPRKVRPDIHPISDSKIQEFIKAISGDKYEDAFYFAIFTGVRQSELTGLTWDCVNFKNGTIRIYRQLLRKETVDGVGVYDFYPLKNGKERTIEPARQVMDLLTRIKKKQAQLRLASGDQDFNNRNFVFTDNHGNHVRYHTMYAHFKSIVESMGIPHTRFHDLRHTFATISIQNGSDIKTVSDTLGHATVAFTMDKYGHVSNTMRKLNADKMEQFIASI